MKQDQQTRQVAAFWDRQAGRYARAVYRGLHQHEDMARRIAAALKPTDHVAEIACGPGQMALALAPGVQRYQASDIAPGMIDIARQRANEAGLAQLTFTLADAASLPYADASQDAVIILAALHLVPDAGQVMGEIRRVPKPGGQLFASSYLAAQSLMSRIGNALMSLIGYRDRMMWQAESFLRFLSEQGFELLSRADYAVFPIPVVYAQGRMR